MSTTQALYLAPTSTAYKLVHGCLVLILVNELSWRLGHVEARVYQALHENDQELMCILLPS